MIISKLTFKIDGFQFYYFFFSTDYINSVKTWLFNSRSFEEHRCESDMPLFSLNGKFTCKAFNSYFLSN